MDLAPIVADRENRSSDNNMSSRNYRWVAGILLLLVASAYAQMRGRVVSSDGTGLQDVLITSEADYLKSDPDGGFSISGRGQVIRFSKSGYRPVTRFLTELKTNVRMVQDPMGLWKMSFCSGPPTSSMISGWNMRFQIPRGVQVRKGGDIDYSTNVVCRGNQCMQHGWGPLWSLGMPPFPTEFLAGLKEMTERDIHNFQAPEFPGVEYRGLRTDGTYMRWVGFLGESISYDHANKESASLFDALIDTFCWIDRKP
jgi:hypothetical protein